MQGRVWVLFCAAWLLRAAFVAHHASLGWQLAFDPSYYLALAGNIGHGVYSLFHPLDIPDTTRMPGYPVLIHLHGDDVLLVLLLQVVVSAVKVPLVHAIALRLGLRKAFAVLAALLMAMEPVDIILAGSLLTETLFTTLLLCGVHVLLLPSSSRNVLLAALCFAAAAWFRPNGLPLVIIAAVAVTVTGLWPWRRALVMAATAALLVLPWTLRNLRETGRFILSDGGAVAAAYFHLPDVLHAAGDPRAATYREALDATARSTDWSDKAGASAFFKAIRAELKRTFRDHPTHWMMVQLRDTVGIYLSPGRGHVHTFFPRGSLLAVLIIIVSMGVSLLLVFALPVWVIGLRSMPSGSLLALLLAGAMVFSGSISTADARFKNPAMPLLLLGCAWAVQRFLDVMEGRAIHRRVRQLVWSTALFAAYNAVITYVYVLKADVDLTELGRHQLDYLVLLVGLYAVGLSAYFVGLSRIE